jgi:hypothetical protein
VNVNPLAKDYSFNRKGGTDLKTAIADLPLFWQARAEKIDINPEADREALGAAYEAELARRRAAWNASLLSHAGKSARKISWTARYGVPRWISRAKGWYDNPDSLSRVLDERDRGTDGVLKSGAKKLIYSAITRFKGKK